MSGDGKQHPDGTEPTLAVGDTLAAPGTDATGPTEALDATGPTQGVDATGPTLGELKTAVLEPTAGTEPTAAQSPLGKARPRPQVVIREEVVLATGLQLQQYELIRELGRGGMGRVFLARDTRLGRRVAIKFLHARTADFLERFLAEARTTAQFQHENIVIIYDVGDYLGVPFMALEYLEGKPLNELLQGQRLTPTRCLEVMVPVVRALVRAHDAHIVHRDLKPDNIFVCDSGVVKVLDFGIAKLFGRDDLKSDEIPQISVESVVDAPTDLTEVGKVMGTQAYMSPEQWRDDGVDDRTDIWAVGLMLYQMVAGQNPLAGRPKIELIEIANQLDEPLPSVADEVAGLPADLEKIIDRCLKKRKEERFASAQELLDALEPLLQERVARPLGEDQSPYPGLAAFQEHDAGRFFGRQRAVATLVARMRERPLTAVVGPSGVGKSSFVRAGLVPFLKASGEAWEVLITRPGPRPLSALAQMILPLTRSARVDATWRVDEHKALVDRLVAEPGYLGALLRSRAEDKQGRVLLFVDQLEEIYTLVSDPEERQAFFNCLSALADDVSSPARVVVSMRSDFLDRAAVDERFMAEVTRGLFFLQPLDHDGLTEAITQPAEQAGFRFEETRVVEEMVDALKTTPGSLPLLQFVASKMWEARDRRRKLLTTESYASFGGVGGALATHADEVLSTLPGPVQKLARNIFERLVTPEGTRAVVDKNELLTLSADPDDVDRILETLVEERLLTVQTRTEEEGGAAIEIVHESLIDNWPTLRRWLDEDLEHAAFLEQLRPAVKQWDARGRPPGLLWRGEALEDAQRFRRRFRGTLSALETQYLDAAIGLAARARRIRRSIAIGAFGLLVLLVVAAGVALIQIREAEQEARSQAAKARRQASRALAAERLIKKKIAEIEAKERARLKAQREADQAKHEAVKAKDEVATGKKKLTDAQSKLKRSYKQLERALARTEEEKERAENALQEARDATKKARKLAEAARQANEKLKKLLARERARMVKLLKARKKVVTELK